MLDRTHPSVSQKIILQTLKHLKENPNLSEDDALAQVIENHYSEINKFKVDDIPQDINKPRFGYYKSKTNPNLANEYKKAIETKVDVKQIMSED